MQITEIKKIEDCFDGSVIFKYLFSEEMDEDLMNKIGEGNKLQYFPDFLRPFFKITTPADLQIKGILGDRDFEVIFPQTDKWKKKKEFETNLQKILQD
ncbi:MAG: hypothetical protein KAT34_02770 [Candidatus Aminicenantes bacterium]|nr:hypothetical protein [Candidatus Aminicenantes bacterium]